MEFKISESFLKDYSFSVVVGKDINNVTSKSREIALKLKKVAQGKGVEAKNINPFVNYFNTFVLENEENKLKGFYFDLDNLYGDLALGVLEEKKPFLQEVGKEVVFFNKGNSVFFDEHSVTHSFENTSQGERVKIIGGSKNVMVCFALRAGETSPSEHCAREFANGAKSLFGGSWDVYTPSKDNGVIGVDYKTKALVEELDVVNDLQNFLNTGSKSDKGIKKRRGESLKLVNKNSFLSLLNDELLLSLKDLYPEVSFENKVVLSNSPNFQFGHFSTNIAFELSKTLGVKVVDIAEELAMKLGGETRVTSCFSKIEAAKNGFVNFFISEKFLLDFSLEAISDFEKFSSCEIGAGKVVLIESPSANPNKAMHLGHILNVFVGKSLMSIFSKLGFEVHNDTIINDKGLPICKAMWALKNLAGDATPESEGLKSDHFVDKYYVLGAKKFQEDTKVEEEVRKMLVDWEKGDPETVAIWKKMIDWVLEGHKETMGRLGEEMGHMWFESEIYEVGKEIILNSIDGKKVVKTSDGAVVGKLKEEYGVDDVVLLRSNGTSLYHTQDLGLTKLKIGKFKPWKAIWVVGNEQIAHFQKLFALIDSLQLFPIDNLYHLAYGYVFGKDGKKMSSREGEALSGDGLLDMITEANKGNKDVALGALKYAFLSSDPFKDKNFDLEKAILFTGKSGPYVMYAYARASNILKKVKDESANLSGVSLSDLDRQLFLKCLEYPNVITSSANNYSPSILADYLYDLAKLFSQMYETEKVLDAQGKERVLRVSLVKLVSMILKDGLLLLRIKPLEKM